MENNYWIATQMLIVGMSGVFIVLTFLSLIIWGLRELDNIFDRKQKANTSRASAVANATTVTEDTESDANRDLVAILTAAATVAIGKQVRVEKIFFLEPSHDNWSENGRYYLMSSHAISTKKVPTT